jgi:hypothetical protein
MINKCKSLSSTPIPPPPSPPKKKKVISNKKLKIK